MDVTHQFNDSIFPKLGVLHLRLCRFASSPIDRLDGRLSHLLVSVHEDKVIMALSGKVKVRDERSGRDIAAGDRFTIET